MDVALLLELDSVSRKELTTGPEFSPSVFPVVIIAAIWEAAELNDGSKLSV